VPSVDSVPVTELTAVTFRSLAKKFTLGALTPRLKNLTAAVGAASVMFWGPSSPQPASAARQRAAASGPRRVMAVLTAG
jgi:hypothetical protein